MGTHKKLDLWNKAIELVVLIYELTKTFPNEERFGLTNQMRRAAISIPSNIAEGGGRQSDKENTHFLYIALGSLAELETQIIIAKKLEYIKDENLLILINTLRPKLINYIKYIL